VPIGVEDVLIKYVPLGNFFHLQILSDTGQLIGTGHYSHGSSDALVALIEEDAAARGTAQGINEWYAGIDTSPPLDLAMVFGCDPKELEKLAASFDAADAAERASITPDPTVPMLTEQCWDNTHQGGWSCRDCYKLQHPDEYRQFLDDTVDNAEYNAYLEHIHTPKASEY
jgi:hypothetical protein